MPLLFALALAVAAGKGQAAEKIGTLFGYTLGQALPATQAKNDAVTPEGYLVYRFAPNELADIFPLAQVRVSPATRTIIDIAAAVIVDSEDEAVKKFAALKEWMEKKYGKVEHKKLAYNDLYTIVQKNRKITFFLRRDPLNDQHLVYCNAMDLDAFGKARKEIPKVKLR